VGGRKQGKRADLICIKTVLRIFYDYLDFPNREKLDSSSSVTLKQWMNLVMPSLTTAMEKTQECSVAINKDWRALFNEGNSILILFLKCVLIWDGEPQRPSAHSARAAVVLIRTGGTPRSHQRRCREWATMAVCSV
jgi:hypothetical protein